MKRLIFLSGIIAVLVTGCEIQPYSDFTANYTKVQPGEEIRFTNYSERAISYEWDFGDGYTSSLPNPTHSYTDEGTYEVSLTATSQDNNVDIAYLTIEVYYTVLEITVAEWNQSEVIQFIVPDALVILYESYNDWQNDLNYVIDGYTDNDGVVTFVGLAEIPYYVYVEASNVAEQGDRYDNLDFSESYIRTPQLIPCTLNTFTAWADYFPAQKNASNSRRNKYPKDKIKSENPSFVIVDVSN